jgi:hypothetical protein
MHNKTPPRSSQRVPRVLPEPVEYFVSYYYYAEAYPQADLKTRRTPRRTTTSRGCARRDGPLLAPGCRRGRHVSHLASAPRSGAKVLILEVGSSTTATMPAADRLAVVRNDNGPRARA